MKCFYHSSDLDGHCSGAIVRYRFPACELIPHNYGQPFPWETIAPGERVFLVDLSLQPFSDMIRLDGLADLVWIDHHQSALKDAARCGQILPGFRAIGRAGCELTWQELFPKKDCPLAVRLLGRYDVWDHADPRTLPFQYGMRGEDTDPRSEPARTLWASLFEENPFDFARIYHAGEAIYGYVLEENRKYVLSGAFETQFEGRPALALNRGLTNSQVFDALWDPEKYDLMVSFFWRKGSWTVSLFTTREDVDCSALAKKYGGGGHAQAAGFQCPALPFELTGGR